MFLTFALITLLGALAMFKQRNAVQAGLCLVLCFLGMAGLFLLLSNPVAAALQIIVYSGAIMVLVLFVIMMLDDHEEEPPKQRRAFHHWLSALLVSALGAGAIKLVVSSKALEQTGNASFAIQTTTLQRLGTQLMDRHLLSFEMAGLLLLATMVAAVSLVKKDL